MYSLKRVLRRVTTGEEDTRVRATWRGIVPWLVAFAIQFLLVSVVAIGIRSVVGTSGLSDVAVSLVEPALLGAGSAFGLIFAAFLAARLDERSVSAYGIVASREELTDWVVGLAIGFLTYAVPTAVFVQLGEAELTASVLFPANSPSVIALGVTMTAIAFLFQVAFEEFAFRGVMLKNFAEGLTTRRGSQRSSVVFALLTSSILFGVSHVIAQGGGGTEGRTLQIVISSTLMGLLWGGGYVLTGKLTIPFGLHLAHNLWPVFVLRPAEAASLAPALGQVSYGVSLSLLAVGKVLVGGICLVVWLHLSRGELTIKEAITSRVVNSTKTTS